MPLTIATVNVNGLRAAARKGMHQWIDQRQPEVIALQEVRAPDGLAADLLDLRIAPTPIAHR